MKLRVNRKRMVYSGLKLYKRIWILSSIVVSIYCIFKNLISDLDAPICLIPIAYTSLLVFFNRSNALFGLTPGNTVVHIIMYFRYIVVSLVLCETGELSIYANNYNHMLGAVALMIYEMTVIFITLSLCQRKTVRVFREKSGRVLEMYNVKPSFLVGITIISVALLLYFTNKTLVNNISLITQGVSVVNEDMNDVTSYIKILWQCLTCWIYVYAISRRSKTIDEKSTLPLKDIIFTLIIVLVSYLGQSSISRWYTLVISISGIFMLLSIHPNARKKILVVTMIPIFILLITATLFKSGVGQYREQSFLANILSPSAVDAYFAGPVAVNNAIGLANDTKIGINSFFYDVLNNMPIVNHFVNRTHSSAYLYNEYIGRIFGNSPGDQIIPLVGQSYIYFTVVFAPFLSVISIIVLNMCDRFFIRNENFKKFAWAFTAVWFGIETILNMTINLSWIYIRIFPLFAVFWLIDIASPQKAK